MVLVTLFGICRSREVMLFIEADCDGPTLWQRPFLDRGVRAHGWCTSVAIIMSMTAVDIANTATTSSIGDLLPGVTGHGGALCGRARHLGGW